MKFTGHRLVDVIFTDPTSKVLYERFIIERYPFEPANTRSNFIKFVESNLIMHTAKLERFLFDEIRLINLLKIGCILIHQINLCNQSKFKSQCVKKNYENKITNELIHNLKLCNLNLLSKYLFFQNLKEKKNKKAYRM